MSPYIEGILDKLSKKEIIDKVEAYINVNNIVLEEIRKFKKFFVKVESEINIVKKFNTLLNKRVVFDMEKRAGQIPSTQEGSVLKLLAFIVMPPTPILEVLEVFNKLGCKIPSRDIEACHRLTNKNDQITVKFSWRTNCDHVMSVRTDL